MLPIAFLGLCDGSEGFANGHPALWRQNILGLRTHLLAPVYPWTLRSQQFVFALFDLQHLGRMKFSLVDDQGAAVVSMTLRLEPRPPSEGQEFQPAVSIRPGSPALTINAPTDAPGAPSWRVMTIVPPEDAIVWRPGRCKLVAEHAGVVEPIGYLDFHALQPQPLTPDRIAAIKANPVGARAVAIRARLQVLREFAAHARRA